MDGLVCFSRTYEHQYLLRPKHAQLQATLGEGAVYLGAGAVHCAYFQVGTVEEFYVCTTHETHKKHLFVEDPYGRDLQSRLFLSRSIRKVASEGAEQGCIDPAQKRGRN